MKIAVIGTGNVGSTLGARFAKAGHSVVFGSRSATSPRVKSLTKLVDGSEAKDIASAIAASDLVVLATPWSSTRDVLAVAGDMTGKIVVDCTNPIEEGQLALGLTTSGGEQVASWVRDARVVKAFNMTGASSMANPVFDSGRAAMFVCGNDPEARATVVELAKEIGFDAHDSGHMATARYLEPLAMLWIHLASAQGWGRDFAFTVAKR